MSLFVTLLVFVPFGIFILTGIKGFKHLKDGLLIKQNQHNNDERDQEGSFIQEVDFNIKQARYYLSLFVGQGIILFIMSFAV